MKSWRARQCCGPASAPPAAAAILAVTIDPLDSTVAIVQFSIAVTAATPGAGDLQNLTTADDAPIEAAADATHVRYSPFSSGLTVGDDWTMSSAAGLTFSGGATLGPPLSGVVT